MGIKGNEEADRLAKSGTRTTFAGPEPFCGKQRGHHNSVLKEWTKESHKRYWRCQTRLRTSKKFILPYAFKPEVILNLIKKDIRNLTGLLTGHLPVRGHLYNMRLVEDNICRLCLNDRETTEHLLCECPAAARSRLFHLGKGFPTPMEIAEMAHNRLLRFYDSLNL